MVVSEAPIRIFEVVAAVAKEFPAAGHKRLDAECTPAGKRDQRKGREQQHECARRSFHLFPSMESLSHDTL
jgi:hypothetical protein